MAKPVTSQRLVVSARPRFEIDGEEKGRLAIDLLRLEVDTDDDGLARCEAVFLNWGRIAEGSETGYLYFDGTLLDFGKQIVIKAGEADNEAVLFEGAITELAGSFPDLRPPEIRVRAEDAMQKLRMRERTRFFEKDNDSGIAGDIASDHGLGSSADANGAQHKELWQVNQNDLWFLRERARAADARLGIAQGALQFTPRRGTAGDPIRLSRENELLRFEGAADLAHQRSSVFVHGFSVANKEAIHESASTGELQSESNGGRTGAAILDNLGWSAIEHLHLEVPATSDEARTLAKSRMLARGRRFLFGRGTTDGTPRLKVGSEVELLDLGPWFSGRWSVCSVRHTFDLREGLRTHFAVERVDIGRGG